MDHVSARSLLRLPVLLGLLTSTLLMGCDDPCKLAGWGCGGSGGAGGSGGGTPASTPCDATRWIGIKPPESVNVCEDFAPGDWKGEPLFQTSPGGFLPKTLERYCLFTWTGQPPQGSPSAADVQDLLDKADSPNLEGFAEDCPAVFPQTNVPRIALEQRRWIHKAAGGVASLPPTNLLDVSMTPVRLAIIDTAPDNITSENAPLGSALLQELPSISSSSAVPRPGEHGEVLAYVARDLGCPEDPGSGTGACPVHAETVLAMPDGGPDPVHEGGLDGTKGDLAKAIWRTVDDWRQDVLEGGESRLVLNLSLGWEDHSNDPGAQDPDNCHVEQPDALNAPARSVYDAIAVARCHGAAVLAAAGNATGGNPEHDGLLCPAYFTRWNAPSNDACDDPASPRVDPEFAGKYASLTALTLRPKSAEDDPLVTAVGAVDYGDHVLTPHRPRSLPPLVGPGAFATAYEGYFATAAGDGDFPLPVSCPATLSGTSVGTLVASAVTAAAWAYEPSAGAADVAALVYTHAAALDEPGTADPMTAEQPPDAQHYVRRASLCRTLVGIGVLDPLTKCSDLSPNQGTEQPPQNPAWSPAAESALIDYYDTEPLPITLSPEAWTSTPLFQHHTVGAGLDALPQPVWPTCTTCGITPGGPDLDPILYLDLSAVNNVSSVFLVQIRAGAILGAYPLQAPAGAIARRLRNLEILAADRFFLQWSANDLQWSANDLQSSANDLQSSANDLQSSANNLSGFSPLAILR